MTNEERTDLIIRELSKHHDRQEIVRKVCESSSLSWSEAEQLIAEIESQHRRKIASRQGPLLLFVSLGTAVLGIVLFISNIEVLMALFNQDLLEQLLSLRTGYYRLAALLTGLAMAVGGLYGVGTTVASLLPDK